MFLMLTEFGGCRHSKVGLCSKLKCTEPAACTPAKRVKATRPACGVSAAHAAESWHAAPELACTAQLTEKLLRSAPTWCITLEWVPRSKGRSLHVPSKCCPCTSGTSQLRLTCRPGVGVPWKLPAAAWKVPGEGLELCLSALASSAAPAAGWSRSLLVP